MNQLRHDNNDTITSSQSFKDQNDQLKESVSSLKNELKVIVDRYTNDKIITEKVIVDLKEELIKCQSSLKESDSISRSYERDTDRLKMELDMYYYYYYFYYYYYYYYYY